MFLALGILTLIVGVYVAGGRAMLKRQAWTAGFFARIEPIEIACWRKSEAILWARFLQGAGLVLTLLTTLGSFDLSPLFPLLPAGYQWLPPILPLVVSVAGVLQENLRRYTTKPLELVEVPDVAPSKVAAALDIAQDITDTAVAIVAIDAMDTKQAERDKNAAG